MEVSALQPDARQVWEPGGEDLVRIFNRKLHAEISAARVREASDSMEIDEDSKTELDSHANMPVVGANAYILAESGKQVEVNPYTPDYKSMRLPLVDAAVRYDSPCWRTARTLIRL